MYKKCATQLFIARQRISQQVSLAHFFCTPLEYGVWRPNDEMSLAAGTRWQGFGRDIMLPERFMTTLVVSLRGVVEWAAPTISEVGHPRLE